MAKYIIGFNTFYYETKVKTVSLNFYIRNNGIFYNVKNIEGKYNTIYTSPNTFNINNHKYEEVFYGVELPVKTIIRQELLVKNNKTKRNKKYIKYFIVESSEPADFYFGIFGNVKETAKNILSEKSK